MLNDGLRAFNQAFAGFEGQLSINLDFSYAQTSVQKVLNMMVSDIVQQLRKTSDKKLTDADTLTLQFGKKENKAAIVGMEYLLVEESIESSLLKVGNFSAVLYSRAFRDPMTVAILQNYRNIVQGAHAARTGPSSYSFYDFIHSDSVQQVFTTPGEGSIFSDPSNFTTGSVSGSFPRPLTPGELAARDRDDVQNEYIKAARSLGLISANEVKALTKGFKEAYTNEEVDKIRNEIENNPEVVRRVFVAQATKKLTQAAKTIDMVEGMLQEGPLGLMDKSPEGRRIKRFFKAFGIDQIMKEVMLCLTFGLNFEAGRIASAASSALQTQALSIYYRPPEPPKPFMEIPKFDPKMFLPKMRDGNIGEIIKKAVIDALQESALSVVKMLADLISEVCEFNNPAAHDYGAVDINTILNEEGFMSGLDGLALRNNLDPQILRTYLSSLSGILSSVDICNLFSPVSKPPSSLINRIITFNEEYDNVFIQQGLTDISSLMGFINELSALVDVSDLCDEIANMAYVLNQDDVCLALADAPELGDFVAAVPELNFDCMDKENFINDPTITKTIPEVFNMVAETVEVQFINSASTIKEILLQPILIRGTDSDVLSSLDAAGELRPMQASSSLEEPNTGPLAKIQEEIANVMTVLAEGGEAFERATRECRPHPDDILGFPVAASMGVFANIVETIAGALAESKFETGLNGLSAELGTLSSGSGPVVRTYRFKQDFYEDFKGYVRTHGATFSDGTTYIAHNYFSSRRKAEEDKDDDNNSIPVTAPPPPVRLKFGFPIFGTPSAEDPPEEYLRVTYPNNEPHTSQLINIDFKSTSGLVLDNNLKVNLQQSVADQVEARQGNSGTNHTNVYIQNFVKSFTARLTEVQNADPSELETVTALYATLIAPAVENQEFPKAYASLVQNMVDYILENGAFDAATLQSLQLFHMNTDCPEDEVADLLDTQGILEQVTREYAEQACNDRDVSLRDKFRRALKFGLMLLYIQLSISEFIIKNIFVFSAFTIDSMLNDRDSFLFRFFRKQAKLSLVNFLENLDADRPLPPSFSPENMQAIKTDLLSYFGKKIVRPSVIANGGIRYSQDPADVAFPTGTIFTNTAITGAHTATFDDILDYLITERLFFSRVPISNALKKALERSGKTPRPMNEALISSYPVLRSGLNEPPSRDRIKRAAQVTFGDAPNIFVLDELDDPQLQPNPPAERRIFSLWLYTGAGVTSIPNPDPEPRTYELTDPGFGYVVRLLSNLYVHTELPAPPAGGAPPVDASGQSVWRYWADSTKPYQRLLGTFCPGSDAHFEKWYEEQSLDWGVGAVYEARYETNGWPSPDASTTGHGFHSYPTAPYRLPWNTGNPEAAEVQGEWDYSYEESLGPRRALGEYVYEIYEAYFADFPSVRYITEQDLRACDAGFGDRGEGPPSPGGGGGSPSPDYVADCEPGGAHEGHGHCNDTETGGGGGGGSPSPGGGEAS
jgi:hypothetical protein